MRMAHPPLPVEAVIPELSLALSASPWVFLQAAPGAGKSTLVPLALLEADWLAGRSILMLEPRRLAARGVAERMAFLLGETVGQTVGYQVRFERRVSSETRIEVVTEGILTRRLQHDPTLDGVGLVIFDEFHERHLHADLALALCREVQTELRDDLKMLIMSATLDIQQTATQLRDAPWVMCENRPFPVQVFYRAPTAGNALPAQVAQLVNQALRAHDGDVLVFLPGAAEIRRCQSLLEAQWGADLKICPLYGDLSRQAQDQALRPTDRRRVVLATNIAETSLTIEGVCVVVDSGWVRKAQFDVRSGMNRLVTTRVSKASAEQRAGRAGRLGPGVCYRLWSASEHAALLAHTVPEMRESDLAPLLLELRAWGVEQATSLLWLDVPPPAAMAQAEDLLKRLAALDASGNITALGRNMVALPLHPRLAHMLIQAQTMAAGALACDVAALLSERRINSRDGGQSMSVHEQVEALQDWRARGRLAAAAWGLDEEACRRVDAAAAQWRRLLKINPATSTPPDPEQVGVLLLSAYPDRLAQRRDGSDGRYLLSQGRGARLSGAWQPPYLVAAHLDAGQGEARIQMAQSLSLDSIRQYGAAQRYMLDVLAWDREREQVVAERQERFGELVLESRLLENPAPQQVLRCLLEGLRLSGLPWSPSARQLQARVCCAMQWLPELAWPDFDDVALLDTLELWLAPYVQGAKTLKAIAALDLHALLWARLDWQQQQRLEEMLPTHLNVPSGSKIRLEYAIDQPPVLAVKLQELFGLADTPTIAMGRVAVVLHLLSPAQRPIQVTQDLRGFWEKTYHDVRKDLRGRYPRHPWPDDPWQAVPTRGTKRRG